MQRAALESEASSMQSTTEKNNRGTKTVWKLLVISAVAVAMVIIGVASRAKVNNQDVVRGADSRGAEVVPQISTNNNGNSMKMRPGALNRKESAGDACVDWLTAKLEKVGDRGEVMQAQVDATEFAPSYRIGHYENGKAAVATLSSRGDAQPYIDMVHKNWKSTKSQTWLSPHKWTEVGNSLIIMYSDNTVVTADTMTCRMTGLYLPTKVGNEHHPSITSRLAGVREDAKKVKKCVECSLTINGVGVAKCNGARGSGCHPGWRQVRTFKKCLDQCATDFKYGQNCPVLMNACQNYQVTGAIAPTSDIVGGLAVVANAYAYILQNVPAKNPAIGPALNTVFGLLGLALGESKVDQMELKFNRLVSEINHGMNLMRSCMNQKFMATNRLDASRLIVAVEDKLNPRLLRNLNKKQQIQLNFLPNENRCVEISALFAVVNPSQTNIEGLLPWALKGMELCAVNYVALVGNTVQVNKGNPNNANRLVNNYKSQMKLMSSRIKTFVDKGIRFMESEYLKTSMCGYFPTQKRIAIGKINWLKTAVQRPVNQLYAAFYRR